MNVLQFWSRFRLGLLSFCAAGITLFCGVSHAQVLIISEFMASNDSGLQDEDKDYSDWIEILNVGTSPINLQGWSLTDDPTNPAKWILPSRNLAPNAYLVVFASGKDRRPATGNLHTSFKLSSEGGYLALIEPDAKTVEHAYEQYPPQRPDISYGASLRQTRMSLISTDGLAWIFLPTNNDLGNRWIGGNEPFDDQKWQAATNGIGYLSSTPGFAVWNYKSAAQVEDVGAAQEVIDTSALQSDVEWENAPTIDYLGTTDPGHYTLDRPFPGQTAGTDVDDFVILAKGTITIPSTGTWTFGVMSDDGFRLELSRGDTQFLMEYATPRGPSDSLSTFALETGEYDIRLVYFERGGGSGLELFAARGTFSQWNNVDFKLVGDTSAGGLGVRSSQIVSGSSQDLFSLIRTDVAAMENQASSAYIRMPFVGLNTSQAFHLALQMRYEDGFVAYLNGKEAVRRNVAGTVRFDSVAATNRTPAAAAVPETIQLQGDFIHTGANLLAIQGLTHSTNASSFLIEAKLELVNNGWANPSYLLESTPGKQNSTNEVSGFVADVQFGVQRGFFETPFDLGLSCATPGSMILYTTNGSPVALTNGITYSQPIRISRTTALRAAAFRSGYKPSPIATHTYLFLNDVILQDRNATLDAGFPASWLGTSPDYGLDIKVIGQNGTDRYGGKYARTIKSDLKSIPTLSIVTSSNDFFGSKGIYVNPTSRGIAWERRVSVELIQPDGRQGFQVDAGLRIQGGAFRGFGLTKKKSFRLFFRREYGHGRLHYPLFGPDAADEFNTLVLRANNNDGWQWDAAGSQPLYIRDAFALATARDMGMVASHSTFAHLYINGIYWGLYNPVERPDAAFSATYFGGDRYDWDAINFDSAPDGTYDAWNRLNNLARSGLYDNANYQRIQGNNPDGTSNPAYENLLDVDSLIDYMILNCYLGNNDWPGRNWYAGRSRINSSGFKFYPWDTEWIVGLSSDINTDKTGVRDAVAAPYGACKANADFRLRFADHVYRHFFNDGPLYVDPLNSKYDPNRPGQNRPATRFALLCNSVSNAVVAESARWGDQHVSTPYTRDEHWLREQTNQLNNYFPRRSAIVLEQFRRAGLYPRTEPPVFNQNGGSVPVGFPLTMSAPAGTIYYTTNGMDPRAPESVQQISQFTLVTNTAPRKVLVPSASNGGSQAGLSWQGGKEPFDDQRWIAGTGGVGYDRDTTYRSFIQTDVQAEMDNKVASVFIRIPFSVNAATRSRLNYMTLRMRYDDGFAAYLNGTLIASANAPSAPVWNDTATAQNSDGAAILFEEFKVDSAIVSLKEGVNILAIQGLNLSLSSTDFLIDAELIAGQRTISGGESKGFVYSQPIPLKDLVSFKARVLNGSEWSALHEATFLVGNPALAITEIHYHPSNPTESEIANGFDSSELFEFIEFANPGTTTVDLQGMSIAGAIQYSFSSAGLTRLAPGQFLVLVRNLTAFHYRYGPQILVAGAYSGNLSNGGETIQVVDASQRTVFSVSYGTKAPWPASADGHGPSLEVVNPLGDSASAQNWQASPMPGGSPGQLHSATHLTISAVGMDGNAFWFRFEAEAGRGYTIYHRPLLGQGTWEIWQNPIHASTNGPVEIRFGPGLNLPERYFQITTP